MPWHCQMNELALSSMVNPGSIHEGANQLILFRLSGDTWQQESFILLVSEGKVFSEWLPRWDSSEKLESYLEKIKINFNAINENYVAVVVAQLAERSLPIPEVHSSNPDIGKFLQNINLLSTVLYWKDENKRKRGWNGPFLTMKIMMMLLCVNKTRSLTLTLLLVQLNGSRVHPFKR